MKIIHILPELEEGGVERHVLWLSNELVKRGHHVMVVSAGGKLFSHFDPAVTHWRLPVHLKNPLTALFCALRIASRARREGWQLIHAHSRVPAWIAWWSSSLASVPYIVTAHTCFGNRNPLVYLPYRKASANISVSPSVAEEMGRLLSPNNRVILNGLPSPGKKWRGKSKDEVFKFLFIGRLSKVKGIQDLLEAFMKVKSENWRLDVLGNGPLWDELKDKTSKLPLKGKVFLHGFRDDTERWLSECDCFLFPSYYEGMPLTLGQAVLMKVPYVVSDIPEVRNITLGKGIHIKPGRVDEWADVLEGIINGTVEVFPVEVDTVPTVAKMTDQTEEIYRSVVRETLGNGR
ncbi:glycosyltransferase [Thermovirga lienii]|jgi:glycosyltransferase involved in cell wall biosynthesis|uniref:glycosyltransferase n=1 Tax=Thermovirga lienii TaxID=336261 RepID=UPI002FE2549C